MVTSVMGLMKGTPRQSASYGEGELLIQRKY